MFIGAFLAAPIHHAGHPAQSLQSSPGCPLCQKHSWVLHSPTGTRAQGPAPYHGPALIPPGLRGKDPAGTCSSGGADSCSLLVGVGMAPGPVLSPATCPVFLEPWEQVCVWTQRAGAGILAPAVAGVGTTVWACATSAGALGTLRHPGPSSSGVFLGCAGTAPWGLTTMGSPWVKSHCHH